MLPVSHCFISIRKIFSIVVFSVTSYGFGHSPLTWFWLLAYRYEHVFNNSRRSNPLHWNEYSWMRPNSLLFPKPVIKKNTLDACITINQIDMTIEVHFAVRLMIPPSIKWQPTWTLKYNFSIIFYICCCCFIWAHNIVQVSGHQLKKYGSMCGGTSSIVLMLTYPSI